MFIFRRLKINRDSHEFFLNSAPLRTFIFDGLSGISQEIGGRVLMKRTARKKSCVSVPLN